MHCFDCPVSRSVWPCVLDKPPVISATSSATHFRFVHTSICRLYDVFHSEGPHCGKLRVWISSFDWISYVIVYVVSVCQHAYDLRILCQGGCCYMCMFRNGVLNT